jgi:hypothetical protein
VAHKDLTEFFGFRRKTGAMFKGSNVGTTLVGHPLGMVYTTYLW